MECKRMLAYQGLTPVYISFLTKNFVSKELILKMSYIKVSYVISGWHCTGNGCGGVMFIVNRAMAVSNFWIAPARELSALSAGCLWTSVENAQLHLGISHLVTLSCSLGYWFCGSAWSNKIGSDTHTMHWSNLQACPSVFWTRREVAFLPAPPPPRPTNSLHAEKTRGI